MVAQSQEPSHGFGPYLGHPFRMKLNPILACIFDYTAGDYKSLSSEWHNDRYTCSCLALLDLADHAFASLKTTSSADSSQDKHITRRVTFYSKDAVSPGNKYHREV